MATVGEDLIERGRVKGEAKGEANGEAKGEAKAILAVLFARGLVVSDEDRTRVLGCTELPTLDRWLRAAVVCEESGALFTH